MALRGRGKGWQGNRENGKLKRSGQTTFYKKNGVDQWLEETMPYTGEGDGGKWGDLEEDVNTPGGFGEDYLKEQQVQIKKCEPDNGKQTKRLGGKRSKRSQMLVYTGGRSSHCRREREWVAQGTSKS